MIIREGSNGFVMIEQDYHAHISGEIITNWKDSLFHEPNLRGSVEYAIFNHDYGWKLIDKQPFWNDQKQAPYSFIDFPTPPKTVFYKHGIDEIEKVDPYAGLLCSRHYTRFLIDDTSPEAEAFVQKEEKRQRNLKHSLPAFDKALFDFHYGLLQFCDNLSLYICLNEPGTSNKEEHPFFKDGLPVPASLDICNQDKLHLRWKDKNTIQMSDFPFDGPVYTSLKQKVVSKGAISANGVIESYQEMPFVEIDISLEPE
ncbi:DUF3891 family protein [Virgibacillus byunsanensis]|uniref:DUF3891 family protein n=1 Tax=Virgibacillus byunsanensis TaxID=570945 RepID=A0ABW3LI94_9BACI